MKKVLQPRDLDLQADVTKLYAFLFVSTYSNLYCLSSILVHFSIYKLTLKAPITTAADNIHIKVFLHCFSSCTFVQAS